MHYRAYVRTYRQAVREAFGKHLLPLGFTLKKERFGVLVGESAACRVIFQPQSVLPLVQRVIADPLAAHSAYDLQFVLKASGSEDEFQLMPIEGPQTVTSEVDRMVRLLVENCRPVLDGDEAAWEQVAKLGAEADDEALARLKDVGLRLKEDGEWRELPELESVRADAANKLATIVGALALLFVPILFDIAAIVVLGAALFGKLGPEDLGFALGFGLLGSLSVGVTIWILAKVARHQYYWQTSRDGLTIGKLRGKQVIRWADVEAAAILPEAGYEFRTPQGTVRLGSEPLKNTRLEASIWQHLNRVGKADAIVLSAFAMSLWAEIPDEKVEEIQWESPIPPHASDILLKLVAWEAAIWGITLRFGFDPLGVAIVISWWPVVWAVSSLIDVKRVLVGSDRIEAVTALGKVGIPWASVRSVKFVNAILKRPASLQIRGSGLRFIRIPWIPDHPNSTRVMLAILKRLRQEDRFKLLPFPAVLLTAGHGEEQVF